MNVDPAEIIDISQPVSEATAEWPGDRAFSRAWTARIEEGSSVTLGSFQMSAHLGTHADAPLHYTEKGASSEMLPLEAFIGPVQVVRVQDEAVRPKHVAWIDEQNDGEAARRVLFKTQQGEAARRSIQKWRDDFPPILPETVERWAATGGLLMGTDAPSVDPAKSQTLPAHHALARCGVANLENLVLAEVTPGRYWLSALPLRLEGMDAAPTRAVLLRAR